MSTPKSGPEVARVDRDHWPAWIDEHPELFVKSVRAFLAEHPPEQWNCRISQWAYGIVRLTAIPKATSQETRS